MSSKYLGQLLNSQPLRDLEKECLHYHHYIRHVSRKDIDHMMQLKALPSRLVLDAPPPFLGRVLSKAKRRSWSSKEEPLTTLHKKDASHGNSVLLDHLMRYFKGVEPQSVEK